MQDLVKQARSYGGCSEATLEVFDFDLQRGLQEANNQFLLDIKRDNAARAKKHRRITSALLALVILCFVLAALGSGAGK